MTDILKALAAELDEMGGRAGAIEDDELPDLSSDDFRLASPIGGGGMGSVYEAEQISLGRRVAVKLVRSAAAAGAFAAALSLAAFVAVLGRSQLTVCESSVLSGKPS